MGPAPTGTDRSETGRSGVDGALVARLRAGEEAAFAELIGAHGPRMLAVARRLLRDEDDAQDAVQEAFLSAFRGLDRFDGRARLSTWLHRIALNAALMRQRSRGRRPEQSIDDLLPRFTEGGMHEDNPRRWTDPERCAGRAELRVVVRAAIDRLPDSYRTVLLLRDIEGLDTAETAALLDVSPNAVKVRLHRARQALRSLLEPSVAED